jgi:hypothetical protein
MLKKVRQQLHKSLLGWRNNNEAVKVVAVLSQSGLIIAGSVVLFVTAGFFADLFLGTHRVCVGIGALLGIFCGWYVSWRLFAKYFDENE